MACQGGPSYEQMLDNEKAMRLLCTVLREAIDGSGDVRAVLTDEHRAWWYRHRAHDEARLASERASAKRDEVRSAALSKLTEEELRALGVRR